MTPEQDAAIREANDKERARQVHEAVDRLNSACRYANADGLGVRLEVISDLDDPDRGASVRCQVAREVVV